MKATSKAAFAAIKPERERIQAKILSGFRKIVKGTSKEIAEACSLTDEQTRKRLSEMEEKGIISVTGTKKCKTTGRQCQIWELNF